MQLEEVIRQLAEKGRIAHLTLVPTKDKWQASFKETGGTGYRVEIREDPVEALVQALGPRYGKSWEDHLGTPHPMDAPAAPKPSQPLPRKKREIVGTAFDQDIEDLL
jgi:hypothetical protein